MSSNNLLKSFFKTLLISLSLFITIFAAFWRTSAHAVITNQPPVAVSDSYTVHGGINVGGRGFLENDYDPDGDAIFSSNYSGPTAHGYVNAGNGYFGYTPIPTNYVGVDTFNYQVCDTNNLCATGAVTLNVVNSAPQAGGDFYYTRGEGFNSSPGKGLLANDSDSDGDGIMCAQSSYFTAHGWVTIGTDGSLGYHVEEPGFSGFDNFTYQVCDHLGSCSPGTVQMYVFAGNDDVNDGVDSCKSVGQPINVTNGNMYLQQSDYSLPGVGPAIAVTRTFNSHSQGTGLFGKGWSTAYDETIVTQNNNLMRLNEGDSRATFFAGPVGSSSAFVSLEGDFHGQLTQNGSGSFTLSLTDGSLHQFNSAGKLLSVVDRNGNQTTLTYDTNGHLSSITDPFGRVLALTTNSNGQVLSMSDSMGTIASYTYGSGNQLLSVTYADSSGFQFSYDGADRLTSVTDALGNVVESHTYDSQGRALTSEKQGGVEQYTLNYVSSTETDVTDALGHLTKYTFDTSKDRNVLTKVEGLCSCGGGSGSQVQTWTYDNQLNVTSKTDALNHTTIYTYDTNGNILTETDATGTVLFSYNQFGEVLTRTDQLNGVMTNTYDAQGNLLITKDALNNTTTFTYNMRGQLLTLTNARGKVTTFTYDASGNLTQIKNANNIPTSYFYDARSRLTRAQDALNRSTLFAYDAAGRVNKITYPDNSFASLTYDLAGRRTSVTDERGNSTNYAYDTASRLTSVTDALSHATTYGYDAMSNLTSMTDALSRTTNYEYDDFDRIVKVTYPSATTGATRLFESLVYDAAGNVAQYTNTAGRVTSYLYDNVNRMVSMTDDDNKTSSFEYDALSRVTGVLDALNQHYQFAYDAMGHQTQITRGGISMSYVYDTVGNRTQRTDYNGIITNYAYDNLNRLTTITYPTRTVTYAYTSMSQLSRATNENGSVYLSYDNRYRISSFSDPFFYGVSYNYDAVGNRTKLSVNGATYATYTYNAVNRSTTLKDSANLSFTYTYDDANRVTTRTAPNSVTTSYIHDALDRLTSLVHQKGANTLIDNEYQYNDSNSISSWTNTSGIHAYTYDLLDRLASVTHSASPNESYAYDALGNRTASHLSASYSYQPFNKLTSTATGTYSYDNNGNLISKTDSSGTTIFSWNEENQLKQVSLPSGQTINYKYDGLGRRIQRTTSTGANERYVYDGQDVLLDLNASGSIQTSYLNDLGIDNHLRQTSATTGVSYFLTDHLGSTSGLTDSKGNLVEQVAYDSFGDSSGSALTRYDYTGRERDADTGLLYYRARWYDPQVGRFTSEDPIGFDGGLNFYAYVENDPANQVDPGGLMGRGGRGPGHSVSLKRDPWEWLRRFLGRRRRFDGESGHATQLSNRCRELEKWLLSLTSVDVSEANLMRHLMKQYDWCRKKFPKTCNDPSLAPSRSPAPASPPAANFAPVKPTRPPYPGEPTWDDGRPIYPDWKPGQPYPGKVPIMPVNPYIPGFPTYSPWVEPLYGFP